MKARVKATGEIVEVVYNGFYYESIKDERIFDKPELEIMPKTKAPDYWTRLEHTYAGMALQGILGNQLYTEHLLDTSTSAKDARDIIVDASCYLAHALVEKLKEERK